MSTISPVENHTTEAEAQKAPPLTVEYELYDDDTISELFIMQGGSQVCRIHTSDDYPCIEDEDRVPLDRERLALAFRMAASEEAFAALEAIVNSPLVKGSSAHWRDYYRQQGLPNPLHLAEAAFAKRDEPVCGHCSGTGEDPVVTDGDTRCRWCDGTGKAATK